MKRHDFEVAEIKYRPFYVNGVNSKSKWRRAIVKRVWLNGKYNYYGIVTNDELMSPIEVLHFYNQRGDIERNFDDLKNNFNWGRLPFSFLNENTAFMIIGGMASIIYRYLIKMFSKKLDFVKRNFRDCARFCVSRTKITCLKY